MGEFEYTFAHNMYCDRCRNAECITCRVIFINKNHQSKKEKFCSRPCYNIWLKENVVPPSRKGIKLSIPAWNKGKEDWGVIATCPQCEKGFRIGVYRIKQATSLLYCSKECRSANAITPENKRLRKSKEFADWRKAVFERDDYTCQFCRARGVVLHPDHIKQWALYPELRFDINNGRTLCEGCHRQTPTWGRRVSYA